MTEQSPKTPRQVGEEAQRLYYRHNNAAWQYTLSKGFMEDALPVAHHDHGAFKAKENGENMYKGRSLDKYSLEDLRAFRDDKLGSVVRNLQSQWEASDAMEANVEQAAKHYKDNAAAYHTLAMAEAALDGVDIQVQYVESPEEPVDVEVK
jgi:hypothetical protein